MLVKTGLEYTASVLFHSGFEFPMFLLFDIQIVQASPVQIPWADRPSYVIFLIPP